LRGAWLVALLRQRNYCGAIKCIASSAAVGAATVKFHDGTIVPALGQGSAGLAEGKHPEAVEEEALRTRISLGMTLIDTAELYSNGRSEELIGRVIAGQRDRVFLVSKVWRNHVKGNGIARACEASLPRLGTDHLDLYLLHWPSRDTDLSSIVAAFEAIVTHRPRRGRSRGRKYTVPMSVVGQRRRSQHVRNESAYAPIAAGEQTSRLVGSVRTAEIRDIDQVLFR
jgi:hypothetical protein